MKTILAGDIGGTKVVLALYQVAQDALEKVAEKRYVSADYADFHAIIHDFRLAYPDPIVAAGLGVAGPVFERTCKATNLPWVIDARELEVAHHLGRVALINDFKAAALGVLHLQAADWVELNPEAKPVAHGPIAVLGAGTGLGEAFLFYDGGRYHVIPTEGGHTDFAPRNEAEIGLLRFLMKRHGRVSYERVLAGAGLAAIYDYVVETRGAQLESLEVREAIKGRDAASVISEFSNNGADSLCTEALDIFMGVYGAEAGNLALKVIATGGVYVTGGIAPKNLTKIKDGTFLSAYTTKGRFSKLVAGMPVRVITHNNVGLLGAVAAALELEQLG
jgi:glucokinase